MSNFLSFLDEVQRLAEDHTYWIRSEAALAMGALAKVIPEELVHSIIVS
jgi:serine/threonine-protein phosphatase 4 regulatory subunit 1